MKINVAKFTKKTGQHDVGRWELWSCDETTGEKGHNSVAVTKKVTSFLMGKIEATPSVAAPGTPTLVTPLGAITAHAT